MRNASSVQKEQQERIHPGIFHPRYYHLRQLKRQMLRILGDFRSRLRDQELLDYGCGSMPYRSLFAPYVQRYLGADIPENTAADVTLRQGRVELPDAAVGTVLSTQVLEHVPDPQLYLSEAFRILKPGGLLLLSTHGIWRYHPDPSDYWRWTSEGLDKIIREAGFKVLEVRGVMGMASMGILLVQDGLYYKLPGWLRLIVVPPMQGLMWLMDQIHTRENRRKDAGVFVFVAEKPLSS